MTEPGRGAEVGAIVCGEGASRFVSETEREVDELWWKGLANICVITNHTTIIRQRIDVAVPRKRKGGSTALGADKVCSLDSTAARTGLMIATQAHLRFNAQVYAAVVRHFDLDALKVLIIASPGFTKESVYQYIIDEAAVSLSYNSSLTVHDLPLVPTSETRQQVDPTSEVQVSPPTFAFASRSLARSDLVKSRGSFSDTLDLLEYSARLRRSQLSSRTQNSHRKGSCSTSVLSARTSFLSFDIHPFPSAPQIFQNVRRESSSGVVRRVARLQGSGARRNRKAAHL